MDPVGFAFSVLGTAQLCFTLGHKLRIIYNAHQDAQEEMDRHIVQLDHSTFKVEYQAKVLEQIWDTLDPSMQDLQNRVLEQYHVLLKKTEMQVDSFWTRQETPKLKKVKLSVLGTHLDELLNELEKWERRYDPTWLLIARTAASIPDPAVLSQELSPQPFQNLQGAEDVQKSLIWLRLARVGSSISSNGSSNGDSVFLDPQTVPGPRKRLAQSSLRTAERQADGRLLLIQSRERLAGGVEKRPDVLINDVRDFARCFRDADPLAHGMLPCIGAISVPAAKAGSQSFELVFESPNNLRQPRSLRQLLAEMSPPALNDRVQLAKLLARSVLTIHEARFLHKNISPESIVVFRQSGSPTHVYPFLLGFEMFRSELGRTVHAGDNLPEKNLYRHPQRQGKLVETDYIIQHDIYSLGVCLLELGLFTSFVKWNKGSKDAEPGDIIKSAGLMTIKDRGKLAAKTKELFVELAVTKLPAAVGWRYADVVLACLTCLDDGEQNKFGQLAELQDEDGILVGVRYIEKVLSELQAISL